MRLFLRSLIRAYQLLASPALHVIGGSGAGCRFEPSCSHYAQDALARFGAGYGTWLAVRRILRFLDVDDQVQLEPWEVRRTRKAVRIRHLHRIALAVQRARRGQANAGRLARKDSSAERGE